MTIGYDYIPPERMLSILAKSAPWMAAGSALFAVSSSIIAASIFKVPIREVANVQLAIHYFLVGVLLFGSVSTIIYLIYSVFVHISNKWNYLAGEIVGSIFVTILYAMCFVATIYVTAVIYWAWGKIFFHIDIGGDNVSENSFLFIALMDLNKDIIRGISDVLASIVNLFSQSNDKELGSAVKGDAYTSVVTIVGIVFAILANLASIIQLWEFFERKFGKMEATV